jgi:hypothetical protein
MNRMFTRTATAAVLSVSAWACGDDTATVTCGDEAGTAQITAYAGAVQTDGSVTVYGTVEYGLTVRSLYVAGVEVTPGASGFNYETWSVSIPQDRLVAYADGSGQAALPVVAHLYGGCTAELAVGQEPVVRVITPEAGPPGNDAAFNEATVPDGEAAQEMDATVLQSEAGQSADATATDGAGAGE